MGALASEDILCSIDSKGPLFSSSNQCLILLRDSRQDSQRLLATASCPFSFSVCCLLVRLLPCPVFYEAVPCVLGLTAFFLLPPLALGWFADGHASWQLPHSREPLQCCEPSRTWRCRTDTSLQSTWCPSCSPGSCKWNLLVSSPLTECPDRRRHREGSPWFSPVGKAFSICVYIFWDGYLAFWQPRYVY